MGIASKFIDIFFVAPCQMSKTDQLAGVLSIVIETFETTYDRNWLSINELGQRKVSGSAFLTPSLRAAGNEYGLDPL